MTFQWRRGQSPREVWGSKIGAFKRQLRDGIILVLELYAPQIEADMKSNAPWTDQTANARQTLQCFVYEEREGVLVLVAKQEMEYGVWLELKNGGRFAIVIPTLEQYYGQIWQSVKDIVK